MPREAIYNIIPVPTIDGADNLNLQDVVGNKLDRLAGDSLYARLYRLESHLLSESQVYPSLANGIDVLSANVDWDLGAFATIVPTNAINAAYHVQFVVLEGVNQNAVHEVVFYHGDLDVEFARFRFVTIGGFWGNARYEIRANLIPANHRIRARMASSNGTAVVTTARLSISFVQLA